MRAGGAAAAILLAIVVAPAMAGCVRSLEQQLASTTGSGPETAFKVGSIGEEYQILGRLGLQRASQALVAHEGRMYDVLTATDPATGEEREVWFDISSFFGRY